MEHQHQHHRGQWGSNFGFLMATVGAAVGLGNIWAFPYKMGASGGFPFLLVYVILAALIGFPIMLSELAIGRKVGRSVIVSYQRLGGGVGTFIGWLAMLSPFLILSFYTVLGAAGAVPAVSPVRYGVLSQHAHRPAHGSAVHVPVHRHLLFDHPRRHQRRHRALQ